MSELRLTASFGDYSHTRALKNGTCSSPRIEFEHVHVSPVTSIFRRMVREYEFDLSEMALSTYLCARHHGKKFSGIPIFLTRSFYHGGISYNVKSGIQSVDDLNGKRIGVRGYTVTPGVWTRGMLQTVHGIDLSSITWVLSGDEHVEEYVAPKNVLSSQNSNLNEMLESGEIDAAIGAGISDNTDIRPLFDDPYELDRNWFENTGIYPISHMVVLKDDQLAQNPWVAQEVFNLFLKSKEECVSRLKAGVQLYPEDEWLISLSGIVGPDPIPYGLDSSIGTLETFINFNVEQQVIPEIVGVNDIFIPVNQ